MAAAAIKSEVQAKQFAQLKLGRLNFKSIIVDENRNIFVDTEDYEGKKSELIKSGVKFYEVVSPPLPVKEDKKKTA